VRIVTTGAVVTMRVGAGVSWRREQRPIQVLGPRRWLALPLANDALLRSCRLGQVRFDGCCACGRAAWSAAAYNDGAGTSPFGTCAAALPIQARRGYYL